MIFRKKSKFKTKIFEKSKLKNEIFQKKIKFENYIFGISKFKNEIFENFDDMWYYNNFGP